MKESIIEEYDALERSGLLGGFKTKMYHLIKDILDEKQFYYHKLEARTKNRFKLSDKIDSGLNKYQRLDQITDVLGVRIITFLDSEVDEIGNLIRQEFLVDE